MSEQYTRVRPGATEPEPFPYVFEPGAFPKLLILLWIGVLVISFWLHYRQKEPSE